MKTLQPSELDIIRQKLINQKVEYIEIIEELTDHIATGIEKQWNETDSVVSFEESLYCEVNKFGDKGLKRVQSKMIQAKILEYGKILLNAVKNCFVSSKLVVIIASFLIMYLLLISTQHSLVLSSFSRVVITAPIVICQILIVFELAKTYNKKYYVNSFRRTVCNNSYAIVISIVSILCSQVYFFFDFKNNDSYHLFFVNVDLTYLIKSLISVLVLVINYCIHIHLKSRFNKDKEKVLFSTSSLKQSI